MININQLMFVILLAFLQMELYVSMSALSSRDFVTDIIIFLCLWIMIPVKDFKHASRFDPINTQRDVTKFFYKPLFNTDVLIAKKKFFTIHRPTYRGIITFPLNDTNNLSLNNNLTVSQRLSSFFPGWPHSSLPPMLLANAGYHYTGVKDIIKCCRCGSKRHPSSEGIEIFKRNLKCKCTVIGDSQRTDSTFDRLLSFFKGPTQFNVLSPLILAEAGYYYTGFNNTIACSHCGTKKLLRIGEIDEFKKDMRCTKCFEDQVENYPYYRLEMARLSSFVNWDNYECASPVKLAEAGFFYAGYSDCVRCFHCGLGLRNWKPDDDIYTEHMRFRPTCQFLRSSMLQRKMSSLVTMKNTAEDTSSLTQSRKLLQQENQALKQIMKCKVCNTAPIEDLFLPCGEMYTCKDCSNKFTHCPSCGKRILGTVTVYLA